MELYPAIDIRGGRCVRLLRGDYDQETVYGDDPVAVAKGYEAAGAPWVHVVDLDAARSGRPENRSIIAAVAEAISIPVQTGGGVRDELSATQLLDAGVRRVVIGTAALENPDLVRQLASKYPGQIVVGLDGRDGRAVLHGWTQESGHLMLDAMSWFEDVGVAAFVVTDVSRDGTLGGPDLAGLTEILDRTAIDVIASGGVGSLDDLQALAGLGRLAGVIVGKALYEGVFTVEEAIAACAPSA